MPIPITPTTGRGLPLHDRAATRALEAHAMAAGEPHALMLRAGRATAELALALAPHARTIWVACGRGNNGGDGLEAAGFLRAWGLNPVVTWLGSEDTMPRDARIALAHAKAAGVTFAHQPPANLHPSDLVVDALLGLGANRAPAGELAQWLAQLRASAATQLAIDVPSGLNADTGALLGAELAAPRGSVAARHHTLTLLTLKPGLFTGHGRDACGALWFADLGASVWRWPPTAQLNAPSALPTRLHASHKGIWGDVAVIGGESVSASGSAMTGAALLAATAALHAGAGRVFVAPLGDNALRVDVAQPALMFRAPRAIDLARSTVVCGCGGGASVGAVLPAILAQAPHLVLDADALNAVAADSKLASALQERGARAVATILTPHPLEAARLLRTDAATVQADRLAAAQALATRFQCVVVLKGSGTVIAAPGMLPRINGSGNARLAAPGTGDVLAGLTGARLAAGLDAWGAACMAVHEHGELADTWPAGQTLTAGLLARRITPQGIAR